MSTLPLTLLPIKDIYSLNIALYIYRTLNVDNSDNNLRTGLPSLSDLHEYSTRNRYDLLVPRFNREKTKNHIHYSGVSIWNTLPNTIRKCSTVASFKYNLKNCLFKLFDQEL